MKRIYLFIVLFMGVIPLFAQSGGKQQYTINARAQYEFGTVTGAGIYNEGDT